MRSAAELKEIFRAGWNIPARIDDYVRHISEFTAGESHVAWRDTLTRALPAAAQLRILDVGTGPGVFACLYVQMGHEVVGLDFSERMLAVARQRAADLRVDCSFVFGDAEEPPFDDGSFDVVSSRHVLFNLPRPGVAVRQWVRLLKPGGRMILIGNENSVDQSASLAACVRRLAQRYRRRRFRRRAGNWSVGPDYIKAISECPLFRHGSGTLRVVLEAAGLEGIYLQSTDDIEAARQALPRSETQRGFSAAPFFILVGVKPRQCDEYNRAT